SACSSSCRTRRTKRRASPAKRRLPGVDRDAPDVAQSGQRLRQERVAALVDQSLGDAFAVRREAVDVQLGVVAEADAHLRRASCGKLALRKGDPAADVADARPL